MDDLNYNTSLGQGGNLIFLPAAWGAGGWQPVKICHHPLTNRGVTKKNSATVALLEQGDYYG